MFASTGATLTPSTDPTPPHRNTPTKAQVNEQKSAPATAAAAAAAAAAAHKRSPLAVLSSASGTTQLSSDRKPNRRIDERLLDEIGEQSAFCHPKADFLLSALCSRCASTLSQQQVLAQQQCERQQHPTFALRCECGAQAFVSLRVQYMGERGRLLERHFEFYSTAQLLHHLRLCAQARVQVTHLRQLRAHCPELMWNAHFRLLQRAQREQRDEKRAALLLTQLTAPTKRVPAPVLRRRRHHTCAESGGRARLLTTARDVTRGALRRSRSQRAHCAPEPPLASVVSSSSSSSEEDPYDADSDLDTDTEFALCTAAAAGLRRPSLNELEQEQEESDSDFELMFPLEMDCSE